jgi:hypothetical protein
LLAAIGVLVVGVLLMAERIDTGSTFLPSDTVAQLTSFLWMGLVFLVVVPLLLGVAIAVVPQLGGPMASRVLPRCRSGPRLFSGGDGRFVPGQRRAGRRRGRAVDVFSSR